jgi:acyl-CoA thioesterase II
MSDVSAVLQVKQTGDGTWTAPHPATDPEGRDVVFSGQMLGQMIMASSAAAGAEEEKEVKSIHGVFARAGSYSAGPVEYVLDPLHSGRAWASNTVTARQGDRTLARSLILLNAVEPDLIRHSPPMPNVPGPEEFPPAENNLLFPGTETRVVEQAEPIVGGSPSMFVWARHPESYESVAASQAAIVWSEPGLIIATALSVHTDEVDISAAHRSISTGVISHTAHFHERADVGQWLLFVHRASYAGHGRIFGSGEVFTRDGTLVSTFAQDSMARLVDRSLDFKKDM